jgi:hypothetical protein
LTDNPSASRKTCSSSQADAFTGKRTRSRKIGVFRTVCEVARANATGCLRYPLLEAAEEFVEFVGGVEVRFQFAGVEAFAEVVEAASQQIQRSGEDFAIG